MSFLNTVPPEQADQAVSALYAHLQGKGDYLPNYARVFSLRPELMASISKLQKGIAAEMDPRLWALVSLAVAREINVSYCSLAYARRLVRNYFNEEQLMAVLLNSEDAPTTAAERAAMKVAVKMARDSSSVTQADIDALRATGYSDTQIFDIVAAAGYRCFFAKVADALGAEPDESLADLDELLLERLVVGRRVKGYASPLTVTPPAASLTDWEVGEFA